MKNRKFADSYPADTAKLNKGLSNLITVTLNHYRVCSAIVSVTPRDAFPFVSALFYHIRSLARTYRCYLADTVSRCCLAGPVQSLPLVARELHRF